MFVFYQFGYSEIKKRRFLEEIKNVCFDLQQCLTMGVCQLFEVSNVFVSAAASKKQIRNHLEFHSKDTGWLIFYLRYGDFKASDWSFTTTT